MKKLLAVILALTLVATLAVSAAMVVSAENDPTIEVASVTAAKGGTVDVKISLKNNPGIASVKLRVAFSSDLSLVSFGDGKDDGKYGIDTENYEETDVKNWVKYDITDKKGFAYQPINNDDNSLAPVSPVTLIWVSPLENVTDSEVTFATLKFKVADEAALGEKAIEVTYDPDDVFKATGDLENDTENVAFAIVNGKVTVSDVLRGDADGNGKVNAQDVTRMRRYIAGGYNVTINEANADIDGNGKVNAQDVTFLRRHLAGGYPSADKYF